MILVEQAKSSKLLVRGNQSCKTS